MSYTDVADWRANRPGRDGRTPGSAGNSPLPANAPGVGALGVVRDLDANDGRPRAVIVAEADARADAGSHCFDCGRLYDYCRCEFMPTVSAARSMAEELADDPEFRRAFGPRWFTLGL